MIIQQLFKTYKENFPLFSRSKDGQTYCSKPITGDYLDNAFRELIQELSELSTVPVYCYMSRHFPDNIPYDKLPSTFKEKYQSFLIQVGKNHDILFATVWFVAYSNSYEQIEIISQKLKDKGIRFCKDKPAEYDSINDILIDSNYTTTEYEAKAFPKFLHQVTQISINLLNKPEALEKLSDLKSLEWMQNYDRKVIDSEVNELEKHLKKNSKYYRDHIEKDKSEKSEFWRNFNRVYQKQGNIYSWPHFLFNICGIKHQP